MVLDVNPSTNMYKVKFIPDGIEKFVHRLNLQFNDEKTELFLERRRVAELARSEAKQIMRLDHFINQQPKEDIRVIRQKSIRNIHEKVLLGLASTIPFPDEGRWLHYSIYIYSLSLHYFLYNN